MKFITVKSKQTTASVDLVPPLVLGDKQRISLVDIRIPEQYFEFTDYESIGTDGRYGNKINIILFSKHLGKYNARRLKQVLNGDKLKAELGLEITITDKAAYLTTQSKEIIVSPELTKNFNIPRELKPYSAVKISGDEKYFVYCNLVENNNSLLSGENNSARIMPSKLLAVAPKSESGVYPELLIPAEKRVINNIILRIENEKFEVPDFNDEEIINVLKISQIKMDDYNKIYPELSKEPPKDGNAFRLQQSCRVLENLEKEAKHYASVRKKYKRCYNLLSRTSTSTGTLSFCLSGSGVGTAFSGVGLPLAASLGGLGLICGVVSVITGEAGKKVSRKVTKHEKTVSVCESKINSLKDKISKALADDRISDEEFENILAEMSKYYELKKDIRVGLKKNKVKKTADGEVSQLRREIRAEILKKLALEEDRRK